jgi:hypothetical protein
MIIAEHHHDTSKEGQDACEPDGKHHALVGFIEHTLHTVHTGAHTFWPWCTLFWGLCTPFLG